MKYRIDEWHHRNPGYLSAPSATSFTFENASNPIASPWDRCTSLPSHSIITPTVKTLTPSLSDVNWTRASERELEQLQIRPRFAPVTSPVRPSCPFVVDSHAKSPRQVHPIFGDKMSNSVLSDKAQARASERELEQLQIRPRVAPVMLPACPSHPFTAEGRTVPPAPGLPMLGHNTLNPSLSDANHIRAIEREPERLRCHTRVAPVTSPMCPNRSFITEDHVESPDQISGPETSELPLDVPPHSPAPIHNLQLHSASTYRAILSDNVTHLVNGTSTFCPSNTMHNTSDDLTSPLPTSVSIPNLFNWTSVHCSSDDGRQSRLQ